MSALPGCVDDVLSVESDVDSLTVVVSEVVVTVVVCGRAVYKRPNIYKGDAPLGLYRTNNIFILVEVC